MLLLVIGVVAGGDFHLKSISLTGKNFIFTATANEINSYRANRAAIQGEIR